MAQLLIKVGDNFPHKDLMFDLRTTDASAKAVWIEREAEKIPLLKTYADVKLTTDQRIAVATNRWDDKRRYLQGEIVNIRKDDAELGKRENYPRFWIARIADDKLLDYLGVKTWEEADHIICRTHEGDGNIIYNRRKLYIPDTSILKPDTITEITTSAIGIRPDVTATYDTGKAVEHNSAGTYSIRSSGGSYATLSAFESGEQCDLTTEGGQGDCVAEFYDDWSSGYSESSYVLIDGWTTDTDNKVIVTVHSGERHTGKTGTGFEWVNTQSGLNFLIRNQEDYTEFRYLDIRSTQSFSYNVFFFTNNSSVAKVKQCILQGDFRSGYGFDTAEFINCLIYGLTSNYCSDAAFTYCTFYGSADRLVRGSACNNCIAISTIASHTYGTFYNCTGDYNCSDDETAPGANSIDNETPGNLFTDASGGDFSLKSGCNAIEAANPITGVTTDIIDTARDVSNPDIGAFEYVAGLSIPVAMHHYNLLRSI